MEERRCELAWCASARPFWETARSLAVTSSVRCARRATPTNAGGGPRTLGRLARVIFRKGHGQLVRTALPRRLHRGGRWAEGGHRERGVSADARLSFPSAWRRARTFGFPGMAHDHTNQFSVLSSFFWGVATNPCPVRRPPPPPRAPCTASAGVPRERHRCRRRARPLPHAAGRTKGWSCRHMRRSS